MFSNGKLFVSVIGERMLPSQTLFSPILLFYGASHIPSAIA
jgi:hypothetical protein